MKGIVFTEFIEMVDYVFSPDITEQVILDANLPSEGVYTATSTYDHHELIMMVVELSKKTETPVPALVKAFGHHLFKVFVKSFPVKIEAKQELFDFLESVENYIHVEVRKLYPDASLPEITCERNGESTLKLHYKSRCPFADLADGLIHESATHFKTDVSIEQKVTSDTGNEATFTITKKG